MKKYLFIVLLVGVWSCEIFHTHDDDSNSNNDNDEIETNLRWIVLRSCQGEDDFGQWVHILEGFNHFTADSINNYYDYSNDIINGYSIGGGNNSGNRTNTSYLRIEGNYLHYSSSNNINHIFPFPVNESFFSESGIRYNWYWETMDRESGSTVSN